MGENKSLHDKVFRIYDLERADSTKKDAIRHYLDRKIKNVSPYIWENFNSVEKDIFIYITIRPRMLGHYITDENKIKKINRSIENYLKETHLDAHKPLKTYNANINALRENHYDSTDSESELLQKYKHLCNSINNYNPMVPKPTFEEWKSFPRRPFDYIESFQHDPIQYSDTKDYPSQSEIDHVIIQLLLKIVQEKANIKIDVPLIIETLTFLKNFETNNYDSLLNEYDPNIDIPKEEQDRLIDYNRQYILYKQMLDNLDFIKKDGTD